jgi:hypothetical protein
MLKSSFEDHLGLTMVSKWISCATMYVFVKLIYVNSLSCFSLGKSDRELLLV